MDSTNFYGVRDKVVKIIKSYLDERYQVVVWENAKSKETKIKLGLPQGSVLGPLPFIIYVNDLISNVNVHTSFKNMACDRETLTRNLIFTNVVIR